jgi:hypothetical protein
MLTTINPRKGAVVDGYEDYERVYAKDQPEYNPLRTLRSPSGNVISRWSLTAEQRLMIAAGEDIFLELMTFNQPLQPILLYLADPEEVLARALIYPKPTSSPSPENPSVLSEDSCEEPSDR